MQKLTLFYDGHCPLCTIEVNHLKHWDKQANVCFEDIHQANFKQRFKNLDTATLDAKLHAVDKQGNWYIGLEATYAVWHAVGKGHWMLPLRWRFTRKLFEPLYWFFAKYRHRITKLIFNKTCPKASKPKKH